MSAESERLRDQRLPEESRNASTRSAIGSDTSNPTGFIFRRNLKEVGETLCSSAGFADLIHLMRYAEYDPSIVSDIGFSSFSDSANPTWTAAASASISSTLVPRSSSSPASPASSMRFRRFQASFPADAKRRRLRQARFHSAGQQQSIMAVILIPIIAGPVLRATRALCAGSRSKVSFGAPPSLISSRNFGPLPVPQVALRTLKPSGDSVIRTTHKSDRHTRCPQRPTISSTTPVPPACSSPCSAE